VQKLPWLNKYNLLIFDQIDSSNAEAKRMIKAGVNEDFVIWANSQTQGRGRNDRVWVSEEGNLYLSLLLNPQANYNDLAQLSFIAALAVQDAIQNLAKEYDINLNMSLKWPNDVMVDDSKIAGILLESLHYTRYKYPALIVGIGLNVNICPVIEDRKITSLKKLGFPDLEIGIILDKIVSIFDKYYCRWQQEGFIKFRKQWLRRAYKINHVITVASGKNRISGIFKDIDFNGAIRIRLAGGQICALSAGEVFFNARKM